MSDIYWRDRASCAGQPGGWDLDLIDYYGVRAALFACSRCPVLDACREWTATLTGPNKPQGVVQAGKAFGARGGHQAALRKLEEMQ